MDEMIIQTEEIGIAAETYTTTDIRAVDPHDDLTTEEAIATETEKTTDQTVGAEVEVAAVEEAGRHSTVDRRAGK